jgi:hypothetical protein
MVGAGSGAGIDIASIYAALRHDETHFGGCPDGKNRKERDTGAVLNRAEKRS